MEQGILIKHDPSADRHHAIRKRLCLLCLTALAALTAAAFLIVPFRFSLMAMCNRLFALSEQSNRYLYTCFTVPQGTDTLQGAILAGVTALLLVAVILLSGHSGPAIAAMLMLTAAQAWLGLSLPPAALLTIYGALAGKILLRLNGRRALLPFAAALAVSALVFVSVFPGTNAAVEAASERVRDLLGTALTQTEMQTAAGPSPLLETRHENQRTLTEGDQPAQESEAYRLVTMDEQQISVPQWVDLVRIILLCLLIPIALVLPFLPFVWMNRQTRRAEAKREALASDDPSAVIRCAFGLVNAYLDALEIGNGQALYVRRFDADAAQLPEGYAPHYAACAACWQEAAYSDHAIDNAQCGGFLALLEQTEAWCYDGADFKTRFRLKYLCCLHA